jgi:hypothetical protein
MDFSRRQWISLASAATAVGQQTGLPGSAIPALLPRGGPGHQFVVMGDSCAGVEGARNGENLRRVDQVLARLDPAPEFVCFAGDNVMGSIKDYAALRRQWDRFFAAEFVTPGRKKIPLYTTTSNHNTYDAGSEQVFREVFADLPRNGPKGQEGLSYWIRRGDLLLVCVNTNFSANADGEMPGALGHGHVETEWLDSVLTQHRDARFKFAAAHVPAYPVNGYTRYPLWRIVPAEADRFWAVLVKHRVLAYLCSHIIAYDVQARDGVLQLTTGGAGTNHGPGGFMPGTTEYLHLVQAAVDARGLRLQVLDAEGSVREKLAWPVSLPPADRWTQISNVAQQAKALIQPKSAMAWRFAGAELKSTLQPQTLLCAWDDSETAATIWIGLEAGRLVVNLLPVSGEGAQRWEGAVFAEPTFDFQVLLHPGMGPGGVLFRKGEGDGWSSLFSTSARGLENAKHPVQWRLGAAQSGVTDKPFRGTNLRAWVHADLLG